MTDPQRCGFDEDAGSYVLGALSPEESTAFEGHLAGCATCSASVREFSPLPGLLGLVPREVVEAESGPAPLPDSLLPQLLDDVRRSRRRQRWIAVVGTAAALVLVGAGVGLGVILASRTDDGESPAPAAEASTAAPLDMTPLGQDEVTAEVSLTAVGWGTRLDLTCGYEQRESGYPDSGEVTYALLVRHVDGEVQQVATWRGLPGKTMHLTGATAWTTDEIDSVEIRTGQGRRLLEAAG